MQNTRIITERQDNIFKLTAKGKFNCFNSHLFYEVLDKEEITHYHALPHPNPGVIKNLSYKTLENLEQHRSKYPLPKKVVFDLSEAEINTSTLTILLQTNELFLKPYSTTIIIPGQNTIPVIEHLRLQDYFKHYLTNSTP